MEEKLILIKNRFLTLLQEAVRIPSVIELSSFIQGEDAFMLKLYLKDQMTPTNLSQELNVTKGRITAIINSLNKRGYLNIETSKVDRRTSLISLSKIGNEYFKAKLDKADKHFERLFEAMDVRDALLFVESIAKVIEKFKEEKL